MYGLSVDTNQWHNMGYRDVLESKIRLAHARIKYLMKGDSTTWNFSNINMCVAAIKHNEELLGELK